MSEEEAERNWKKQEAEQMSQEQYEVGENGPRRLRQSNQTQQADLLSLLKDARASENFTTDKYFDHELLAKLILYKMLAVAHFVQI